MKPQHRDTKELRWRGSNEKKENYKFSQVEKSQEDISTEFGYQDEVHRDKKEEQQFFKSLMLADWL